MPKKLEMELMHEAMEKGMKGKRKGAYVFGTMRKAGWKPKHERKSKLGKELMK